jgi:hypothetical protein
MRPRSVEVLAAIVVGLAAALGLAIHIGTAADFSWREDGWQYQLD